MTDRIQISVEIDPDKVDAFEEAVVATAALGAALARFENALDKLKGTGGTP